MAAAGFGQVVEGTGFSCLHGIIYGSMACYDNYFRFPVDLLYMTKDLKPSHVRQLQIQEDNIKGFLFQFTQKGTTGCKGSDAVTFIAQNSAHHFPGCFLIIYDGYGHHADICSLSASSLYCGR